MIDSIRDLLVGGMAALKAHDNVEACFFLQRVQCLDPHSTSAWKCCTALMKPVAVIKKKRDCLEEILARWSSNPGCGEVLPSWGDHGHLVCIPVHPNKEPEIYLLQPSHI